MPVHQLRVLRQVVDAQRHGRHDDGQRHRHARRVLQVLQHLQRPARTDADQGGAHAHADQLRRLRLAENVDDLIGSFLQSLHPFSSVKLRVEDDRLDEKLIAD